MLHVCPFYKMLCLVEGIRNVKEEEEMVRGLGCSSMYYVQLPTRQSLWDEDNTDENTEFNKKKFLLHGQQRTKLY